jgi:hypothetical protein
MASSTPGETRTVRLWREGQTLFVQPTCEKLLRRVLRTAAHASSRNVGGSLEVAPRDEKLFEVEPYGGKLALKICMGLASVVLAALELKGVRYHFQGGLHHAPLPVPADKKGNGELGETGLLDFVARHDRGVIHYDAEQLQAARLVARVVKSWPEKNITLVTTTREEAYAAVRQLRADKVDAFAFTARSQPWVKKRVAVTTFAGMAYNPVEPCKQDIVIVLNAVHAIGKHARWCLQHAERARLYALLPVQRRLSRSETDLVRCLFGFEEVVVQRQGHGLRPVELAWVPGEAEQFEGEPTNILELKRSRIWHNESRNTQVAGIALAFAAGDKGELGRLLPSRPQLPSGPLSTFVLVENIDHALALMPELPGWPVIASGLVNLDGMPSEQRAELERRLATSIPTPQTRGLVTHTGLWHTRMPWNKIGVLVRADGGMGGLVVPLGVQGREGDEAVPLLVVDLDDAHDGLLRRHARQRRRAYKEQGWLAAGKDPARQRIVDFLKRRLKGVVQ